MINSKRSQVFIISSFIIVSMLVTMFVNKNVEVKSSYNKEMFQSNQLYENLKDLYLNQVKENKASENTAEVFSEYISDFNSFLGEEDIDFSFFLAMDYANEVILVNDLDVEIRLVAYYRPGYKSEQFYEYFISPDSRLIIDKPWLIEVENLSTGIEEINFKNPIVLYLKEVEQNE